MQTPASQHNLQLSATSHRLGRVRPVRLAVGLLLLLIPLLFVMSAFDPTGAGHIAQVVVTGGGELLRWTAIHIADLFRGR